MTPLNDIIGQDAAKRAILRSYNRGRLAATYLFYGPDGTGKWPLAIALAALTNCTEPLKDKAGHTTDACGICINCRQILNLGFSELHLALPLPPHKSESEAIDLAADFIERKKTEPYCIISSKRQMTIPISTARAIKRNAAIKPPTGLTRVILFYQMEKMLAASADSLLKLIEEPPPATLIVLTARDPENLLSTIQSRSQKISFRPLREESIAQYMVERYDVSPEMARLYARLAEGSIGRAVSLIDDEGELSIRQTAFLMFKALLQKDIPSGVAKINELLNPRNRGETEQILSYWQSFLGDLILIKYGTDSKEILNSDLLSELEILSAKITEFDHFSSIKDNFKSIGLSLRKNVHIRPALTALAFNLRKYLNQSS